MSDGITIYEYKVVTWRQSSAYEGQQTFQSEVASLLASGWVLNGGVSIAVSEDTFVFAQSLTRAFDQQRLPSIDERKAGEMLVRHLLDDHLHTVGIEAMAYKVADIIRKRS